MYGTKYSIMDQVRFLEESFMACIKQTMPLQIFKGCLPQFLLGPFLNILSPVYGYINDINHGIAATWIKRKISVSLIKSIGLCIRGSRSVYRSIHLEKSIDNKVYTCKNANLNLFSLLNL